MLLSTRPLCSMIALAGCLASSLVSAATLYPLHRGSTWTYTGTVRYGDVDHPTTRTLTICSSVLWRHAHAGMTFTLVRGLPEDLAANTGGPVQRFDHLFLERGPRLYVVDLDDVPDVMQRLRDPTDRFGDVQVPINLVVQAPLVPGGSFGAEVPRSDGWYRWNVFRAPRGGYLVKFRSLDAAISRVFVPGVGVRHFTYHHFGTVSDVDAHLVRFTLPH